MNYINSLAPHVWFHPATLWSSFFTFLLVFTLPRNYYTFDYCESYLENNWKDSLIMTDGPPTAIVYKLSFKGKFLVAQV